MIRDELLGLAARLVPTLKGRAARAEQLRQITPETVRDLLASGLIRIGNPRRYGGHDVEVDAAYDVGWELGHRHDIREMLDKAAQGAPFSEMDRARYRRDKAYVAKLCVEAVNRLFEASGAHAVLEPDPMQRFHRDAHGAPHHAALTWDVIAEQFGRQALNPGP
ncbi:MAG: hypothetical protein ACREKS_03740 [Candidatus Rokuibacteriota bacterium]